MAITFETIEKFPRCALFQKQKKNEVTGGQWRPLEAIWGHLRLRSSYGCQNLYFFMQILEMASNITLRLFLRPIWGCFWPRVLVTRGHKNAKFNDIFFPPIMSPPIMLPSIMYPQIMEHKWRSINIDSILALTSLLASLRDLSTFI